MKRRFIKDLTQGSIIDLGSISLSEQDIIDFALLFDPLDFHINKEVAEKSMFKGLVASGPHIFNLFYRTKWMLLFKESIMAGMELTNWKFLKPIYANKKVFCKVIVADMQHDLKRGSVAIKWHFDFLNERDELVQVLDVTVLHNTTK